jgi:hypothetical protein
VVHPNAPGTSHLHEFYGSRDAKAASTYRSMVDARTTCSDDFDSAGYWHPRLFVAGVGKTGVVTAWYSKGGLRTVRAFPRGMKLLAGDMMATELQSRRDLYWRCAGPGRHRKLRTLPHCNARQDLTANLVFPTCWDGVHLDTADHRSHVTYASRHRCPASHPVGLPRLTLEVRWHVHPRPSDVSLASGSFMTMHADFWNTWHQARLRSLVNQCVNTTIDCGVVRRTRR